MTKTEQERRLALKMVEVLQCPHCEETYWRSAFYEDGHYLPFHCVGCGHHIEEGEMHEEDTS